MVTGGALPSGLAGAGGAHGWATTRWSKGLMRWCFGLFVALLSWELGAVGGKVLKIVLPPQGGSWMV